MSGRLRVALVVLLAVGTAGLYAYFQPGDLLTLERLKETSADLAARRNSAPGAFTAFFFGLYVVVAALPLPGAALLTLAAGALFGLGRGALLVSFASSLGATLAFLASRYLLRDLVQQRVGAWLPSAAATGSASRVKNSTSSATQSATTITAATDTQTPVRWMNAATIS